MEKLKKEEVIEQISEILRNSEATFICEIANHVLGASYFTSAGFDEHGDDCFQQEFLF